MAAARDGDALIASNAVVLITGGASGIGLALAGALSRSGAAVVICGRDQAKLDAACASLPGVTAIRADLGDAASRAALVAEIDARHPTLDMLINNAGSLHVGAIGDPSFPAALEEEVMTNLVAPSLLTAALLPRLLRQKKATIVNVTTGYVFLPSAMVPGYSASKAGMHAMTRALRFQLRKTNVRVVEVMPPAVDTAMARHYRGAKLSAAEVASRICTGLITGRTEIPIGVSRAAKVMARLMPDTAFAFMNRGEQRAARRPA